MDVPSTSLANGVQLPLIGLGTTHSGGYYHNCVVAALRDYGYRMIDTAKRYGVESELGIAWQEARIDREDLFLCSKLWPTDFGKGVDDAFAASCTRLQTDYLDLYMIHVPLVPGWMAKEALEESWRRMELLYDRDAIRSIGVSNFSVDDLTRLMDHSSVIPHVNQCEMHPWYNPKEPRLFCQENDITFTGYCPMAKGRYLDEALLKEIGSRHGKTPAQVCLRWSVQQGVSVIPKSTSKKRVLENIQIFDFSLTDEELQQMDRLSSEPHKVVTFDKLEDTLKLPDGYKLKGRVYGVPCGVHPVYSSDPRRTNWFPESHVYCS